MTSTSSPPPPSSSPHGTLVIYQDVVKIDSTVVVAAVGPNEEERDQEEEEALSLAFFELANVEYVGYRLSPQDCRRSSLRKRKRTGETLQQQHKLERIITVRQDTSACGQHTGGIVWETSYLLLNYLLAQRIQWKRTLEVGAGCGILGLTLAASRWARRPVVLTEVSEAMENLRSNVRRNQPPATKTTTNPSKKKKQKECRCAIARPLDWRHPERDVQGFPDDLRFFDTIVGTDVVFALPLVEPLLSTLQYVSHDSTTVYLCLQIRCADSHQRLLHKAGDYGWMVTDLTQELASIPSCAWGIHLECRLLRGLTRSNSSTYDELAPISSVCS